MKDSLGDRMKKNYEDRYRFSLPNKSYIIFRIDGRAFHTFTKDLKSPFDEGFVEDMNTTASVLCKEIAGAKFAYVQSDEISILATDIEEIQSQSWFENNIQKMVSVASSIATKTFNQARLKRLGEKMKWAEFDCRAFLIPAKHEVANYFLWRQQDCTRNSISMVARSLYSHKELEKKNSNEKQEMIFQKGINWDTYDPKLKRGRFIEKEVTINGEVGRIFVNEDKTKQYEIIGKEANGLLPFIKKEDKIKTNWVVKECPIFSKDWSFINTRIPEH
jgi:tRNA(His) 5'-end guanylyltransferase